VRLGAHFCGNYLAKNNNPASLVLFLLKIAFHRVARIVIKSAHYRRARESHRLISTPATYNFHIPVDVSLVISQRQHHSDSEREREINV
jgi:hypothetical protein